MPPPMTDSYVQRSPYPPPPPPMTGSQHHCMPVYAHAQSCYPTSAGGYYGNGMDYLSTMQFAAKPTNGGCGAALSSYCAMSMNVPGHMTGHVTGHVTSQMGYGGGLDGSGYLTRGVMTPSSPECMDTKEWGKFHPI